MTRPAVFVSRPGSLAPHHEPVWAEWQARLTDADLKVITIPRMSYMTPPWPQFRAAMSEVDGALVLGLRRSTHDLSAWNQIEAGLAVMAGVPVLAAAEVADRDGVFAADIRGGGVYGTTLDVWTAGEGTHDPAVRDWLADVRRHAAGRGHP